VTPIPVTKVVDERTSSLRKVDIPTSMSAGALVIAAAVIESEMTGGVGASRREATREAGTERRRGIRVSPTSLTPPVGLLLLARPSEFASGGSV
jgi:hypothetical protein